jgi:hypothetical protein
VPHVTNLYPQELRRLPPVSTCRVRDPIPPYWPVFINIDIKKKHVEDLPKGQESLSYEKSICRVVRMRLSDECEGICLSVLTCGGSVG